MPVLEPRAAEELLAPGHQRVAAGVAAHEDPVVGERARPLGREQHPGAVVGLHERCSPRRQVSSAYQSAMRSPRPSGRSLRSCAQTPIGCQTVLVSRNERIRESPGSADQSSVSGRRTRFTLSAAAISSSRRSVDVVDPGEVDRVDVHVRGEPRRHLGDAPGQQVDDAAGHVGGREHLGQRDRRRAAASSDASTTAVLPRHDHRRHDRHEAEQRRLLRRHDGDDAGRLGDGEVEVRPCDGVRAAEHLRELVGPAGVPDPAVDRRRRRRPRRDAR